MNASKKSQLVAALNLLIAELSLTGSTTVSQIKARLGTYAGSAQDAWDSIERSLRSETPDMPQPGKD